MALHENYQSLVVSVFNKRNIFIAILIIAIDISIYVFLGLLLINYEDFYDSSKGSYYSLASMTFNQKIYYITFIIWEIINIIGIGYLIIKVIQKIRKISFSN